MSFDSIWVDVRERAEGLSGDVVLVTPSSERAFVVEHTADDRIDIGFHDTEEKRTLWRDQFAVLHDRSHADSEGISLSELPLGVEPYVSILSLSAHYTVDESANALRSVDENRDAVGGESPFVRSTWEVRSTQERVHDDVLLLADQLERHSLDDPPSLSTNALVDLYVLLSDVQRGANRLRRTASEEVLGRIGPDDRLHSQFGSVHRTRRVRRHLKDAETIFEALDEKGIPRDWVVGVDADKLDVVLTVTDLEEEEVYDVEQQVYVQKTDVEEEAKQSRLQGLKDRLEVLESEEADELQDDIEQLETRLDDLLAAA